MFLKARNERNGVENNIRRIKKHTNNNTHVQGNVNIKLRRELNKQNKEEKAKIERRKKKNFDNMNAHLFFLSFWS